MLDSILQSQLTAGTFLTCTAVSLILGIGTAWLAGFRSRTSQSLAVTLAILPAVVQTVILLVNGNIGAGVAVAGAFGLVRFRSVPGTAREIGTLFLAMGAGLIAGMGYLGFAALFTVVMCAVFLLYSRLDFGAKKNASSYKTLTVMIPEELDYAGVFDEIFARYTVSHEQVSVKTTNMGSLFRLTYHIVLRDPAEEKEMIDKLRCRNGNLEILVSKQETTSAEL